MAMLIGRERPAAILRGEVERALISHGSLVLVTGEAGIGKSTLVADAAEEAVRGGARLLGGACWEGEGAPGYWPWVQVVRQLCPGATPQSLAGADAEAFELYDAVTGLLVAASRERPVVVVLEDLHWADAASLRLLEFVVRHAWFERLLVIGTYRDAEIDGPLSLPLEARAVTLTLTGLDREGVGRLVALTTGMTPGDELVTEIHRRTGGNPFFVEQTARLWQGGSPLATIPPGVGAAVHRRLSRLGDDVLGVLRMAAVLGREFTGRSLITAMDALAPGQAGWAEAVRKALEQAASAKLVVSRGPGRHAFVHDLVRETLYAELSGPRRAALHAAALSALDTALPATRARHAYLAAVPEAADLLVSAARDAEGRMADEEAAGHYRRALELIPGTDPRRRASIGLDLGVAQHRAGDTAAGARTLDTAIAIIRRLDAPDLLAIAALKLHDLSLIAQGRWTDFVHDAHRRLMRRAAPPSGRKDDDQRPDERGDSGREDRAHEDSAHEGSAHEDSAHEDSAHEDSAHEGSGPRDREDHRWREDGEGRPDAVGRELSEVAADLARQGEDDEALGYSLMSRLGTIWGPDTTRERLAIISELQAVARRTRDEQLDLTARTWRIGTLLELGDPRCRAEQRAFAERAGESELTLFRHEAAVLEAMFATLTGRFDEADAAIEAAYELGEQPGLGRDDLRWMQRWSAALLRGRFDVADTVLAEMEHAGSRHFPLYRAVTEVRRGDGSEAALRHLAHTMAAGERYLRWMAPLWLRFQAQVAARTKDPVLCERARAAIAPYTGQWGVTATVAVEGPYTYWTALLDAAQERWDAAIDGFASACRSADLLGARPWSVESRARLAEALQARGDDASELIEQVEREAAELGMLVRLPRPGANAFRFDGEVWTLTFAGRTVHLPDAKGLADLHVLIGRPGADVPAVALLDPAGGEVVRAARGLGGDDVLDEEARVRYRRRLELLDEEIDRAVELGDDRRAAGFDAERQALLDELRTATGLGGRPRRLGDEAERARKAVTNRIRNTLRQLDQRHPELAAHLRASVSTGTTCRYHPATEVRWSTHP
ncbi:ATP-binding protein [Nonomuraea candida]|uniref:ATP-binding protein n=1 Tax=Nonomuraea candida TaxID=359159 RepID=UPI00069434AE|nr:AAA family ATPase [Nonomuraea candida]